MLRRAWALPFAIAAACGGAGAPRDPHAASRAAADPAAAEAACATCHAEIAREHRGSNHAEAFRHATFQEAYAAEPLPFCAGCHAPHADARAPRPPASDLGVGCLACHAELGAKAGAARAAGSDAACARCHEFPYPPGVLPGRLLQKTASEHRASSKAGVSCIQCHMPREGGRRSHAFSASRDEGRIQSAAAIEARRDGEALVITFTRQAAGHAFPTGDVFRRLLVVVTSPAGERRVALGRRTREPAEIDERPFADGKDRHEVRVPVGRGPARWRVVYERVQHPTELDGIAAKVEGSVEVASGEVP